MVAFHGMNRSSIDKPRKNNWAWDSDKNKNLLLGNASQKEESGMGGENNGSVSWTGREK